MASRWAYEAIAVTQYKTNDYEKEFFEFEKRKKFSNWKKDYWITELKNKVAATSRIMNIDGASEELDKNLGLLRNELNKENGFLKNLKFNDIVDLTPDRVNDEVLAGVLKHLELLTEHYRRVYLKADAEKEDAIYAMTQTDDMQTAYKNLFNNYKNDQLEVFATNRNDVNYIAEYNGELIQKKDLIYLMPYNSDFFGAHFYAPAKNLYGRYIDTFYANLLVLWGMTIGLAVCLFFDVFPRTIRFLESNLQFSNKEKRRET